jgi:hydrogenase maturation protease
VTEGAGPVLVIGYGNPLRRDDGIGPYVAGAFAGRPGVRALTPAQLVPELVADLADARLAVFVDARAAGAGVEVARIAAGEAPGWSAHAGDPRALLALTAGVHGRAPEAWWVLVAGADFGFGEGLSPVGRANTAAAVEGVEALLRAAGPPRPSPARA